jgi:uncharacterized protein with GYD domain
MAIYIILSQLSHDAVRDPKEFAKVADDVAARIKKQCPKVEWKHSWATLGRYDVVDVVESDDLAQVERAALIIRAHGHAHTQTMVATPWKDFLAKL